MEKIGTKRGELTKTSNFLRQFIRFEWDFWECGSNLLNFKPFLI